MRKSRTFVPQVDGAKLEDRVVLSTAAASIHAAVFINPTIPFVIAPVGVAQNAINFTSNTYHNVIGSLQTIANNYAVTGNLTAAANALSIVSYRMPYGHAELLPVWLNDLNALRLAGTATPANAARVVFNDLHAYLANGVGKSFNILKSDVGWATDNQLIGLYNGHV
jgi:hypothetical protein